MIFALVCVLFLSFHLLWLVQREFNVCPALYPEFSWPLPYSLQVSSNWYWEWLCKTGAMSEINKHLVWFLIFLPDVPHSALSGLCGHLLYPTVWRCMLVSFSLCTSLSSFYFWALSLSLLLIPDKENISNLKCHFYFTFFFLF